MTAQREEFRLGWFSVGDMISIATGLVLVGMMWTKVETHGREIEALRAAQSYGQQQAALYVRKDDYREDIREIKELLRAIDTKVDGKQDRAR